MVAASRSSTKKGLKVTAPLVAVKDSNGNVVHLYQGDVLPDGTSQESIDHLQDLGYVDKTDAPVASDDNK